MNAFRTLIVPAAIVKSARFLSGSLAGKAGEGMYLTPLSSSGQEPATHYISSGIISSEFAEILPLAVVSRNEVGEEVVNSNPGNAKAVVDRGRSLETPLEVTEDQINGIFASVDVSEQDPYEAMARLGLKMVETI